VLRQKHVDAFGRSVAFGFETLGFTRLHLHEFTGRAPADRSPLPEILPQSQVALGSLAVASGSGVQTLSKAVGLSTGVKLTVAFNIVRKKRSMGKKPGNSGVHADGESEHISH
jgi:hypothetical protein